MSFPKGLKRPRGICVECGNEYALSAPSGDWLLAVYPIKHRLNGEICRGSFMETEITVDAREAVETANRKEP